MLSGMPVPLSSFRFTERRHGEVKGLMNSNTVRTNQRGRSRLHTGYAGVCLAFAFCLAGLRVAAEERTAPCASVLTEWHAGEAVEEACVQVFGLERCFTASPVPDDVWERIQGKTYRSNPYIGRGDLRHVRVLHWGKDGRIRLGEMLCNKVIADRLVEIFRLLYEARYAIERMVLPEDYGADDEAQMRANNSSCFCYREVAGNKKLSKHARGLAVDLNPLYNPYGRKRPDGTLHIQPANAARYLDRSKDFPFKIDHNDLAYRLFTERGFTWGGDWRSLKDYQHFELKE